MRRRLLAFIAGAVLLPAVAAGSAAADDPLVQGAGQSAGSQQTAGSSATSTQSSPSNTNVSVRIGSPGDGGVVAQTNGSSATSVAGNANSTNQQAAQQGGAPGVAVANQSATNDQTANSTATSTQDHPSNTNISVRIMSPGDDGSVTQTNDSSAKSAAGNKNSTTQSADAVRRRGPDREAGRRQQAVGGLLRELQAGPSEQRQHPGADLQRRGQRLGQAGQRLVGQVGGGQQERDEPERGAGLRLGFGSTAQHLRRRVWRPWRSERPGRRAVLLQRPVGAFVGHVGAGPSEQRQHPGAHRLIGR